MLAELRPCAACGSSAAVSKSAVSLPHAVDPRRLLQSLSGVWWSQSPTPWLHCPAALFPAAGYCWHPGICLGTASDFNSIHCCSCIACCCCCPVRPICCAKPTLAAIMQHTSTWNPSTLPAAALSAVLTSSTATAGALLLHQHLLPQEPHQTQQGNGACNHT